MRSARSTRCGHSRAHEPTNASPEQRNVEGDEQPELTARRLRSSGGDNALDSAPPRPARPSKSCCVVLVPLSNPTTQIGTSSFGCLSSPPAGPMQPVAGPLQLGSGGAHPQRNRAAFASSDGATPTHEKSEKTEEWFQAARKHDEYFCPAQEMA